MQSTTTALSYLAKALRRLQDRDRSPVPFAGPTTADVDEHDVVTTYDGSEVPISWMHRTTYEALAKDDRDRVVYRGPLGNLRRVEQ